MIQGESYKSMVLASFDERPLIINSVPGSEQVKEKVETLLGKAVSIKVAKDSQAVKSTGSAAPAPIKEAETEAEVEAGSVKSDEAPPPRPAKKPEMKDSIAEVVPEPESEVTPEVVPEGATGHGAGAPLEAMSVSDAQKRVKECWEAIEAQVVPANPIVPDQSRKHWKVSTCTPQLLTLVSWFECLYHLPLRICFLSERFGHCVIMLLTAVDTHSQSVSQAPCLV